MLFVVKLKDPRQGRQRKRWVNVWIVEAGNEQAAVETLRAEQPSQFVYSPEITTHRYADACVRIRNHMED